MVNLAAVRVALTAVLVVGALGATGAAPTQSQFTDEQHGTSNVTAADDFKQEFPSNAVAYDDANRNGQYDGGETTYEPTDLESLENSGVELRFHSSASGWISPASSKLDVANISSEDTIKFETGSIEWSVTGDLDVDGGSLRADTVVLTADDGHVRAAGTKVKKTTSIQITAHRGDVDISNGDLEATNSIQVYATSGIIDVTGTECTAPNKDLQDSTGSVSC